MDIALRPVTSDNWEAVVRLKPKRQQLNWVTPNWYSLLEIVFENSPMASMGIYAGEKLVGYTMYGYDDESKRHWLVRFMIDRKQQKRGYGRAALNLIVQTLWAQPECTAIYLGVEPENVPARELYASLGFVDTGEVEWGELIYRLDRVAQVVT